MIINATQARDLTKKSDQNKPVYNMAQAYAYVRRAARNGFTTTSFYVRSEKVGVAIKYLMMKQGFRAFCGDYLAKSGDTLRWLVEVEW